MPQSVLITGCSAGGIGSALVEEFHTKGLHVYATARSRAKMSHLQKLANVTILELDVVSGESIAAAVETVRNQSGKLNILVNNAGQSLVFPALETSLDDARRVLDVNFLGVIAVTQAFAPLVLAAKGTIVNVCSISGFLYALWMSVCRILFVGLCGRLTETGVYNASKAALMQWSETLRLALQPFGVRVVSLVNGSVARKVMSHAELRLPANSLYHKAIEEIRRRGVGGDVQTKTAPADFAKEVVGDILGGASGPVWRGALTSMVNFMYRVVPTALLVSQFP
jgi:1-acylglycerone phosphate reductase